MRPWVCSCRLSDQAAHRLRLRARRRRAEEPSAPELERKDRPELEIEIAAAVVLTKHCFDVPRVEESSIPAAVRQQQVARELCKLAAEPSSQRHGEPVLRPVD